MQALMRGMANALLAALVLVAVGLVVAAPARAHGGGSGEPSVQIEPQQVTAGGTVVIVGEGMEPDNERAVVLAGQQLVVEFGTVKTDADGGFTLKVTVPSHLPSGVYQVQAIGDETVSADLQVTAAVGASSTAPAPQQNVQPRHVEGLGLVVLVAAVGLFILAGGWLVVFAERLAGGHHA